MKVMQGRDNNRDRDAIGMNPSAMEYCIFAEKAMYWIHIQVRRFGGNGQGQWMNLWS